MSRQVKVQRVLEDGPGFLRPGFCRAAHEITDPASCKRPPERDYTLMVPVGAFRLERTPTVR